MYFLQFVHIFYFRPLDLEDFVHNYCSDVGLARAATETRGDVELLSALAPDDWLTCQGSVRGDLDIPLSLSLVS